MDGILTNEAFLERFRISKNDRTKRLSYPDKIQQVSRCGRWGQSSAEEDSVIV